jgi:SRSO17 transposase
VFNLGEPLSIACDHKPAGRWLSTPGSPAPDGWEHLLGRAVWDQDGVHDDLRDDLVEHLGDPQAVLVTDETGT